MIRAGQTFMHVFGGAGGAAGEKCSQANYWGAFLHKKKKKLIACTKQAVDKYLSSCRGTDSNVPNPPFGYLIATETAGVLMEMCGHSF